MLHAPLVGRDRELAVAHEALVAADGGAGSVLLIEGEAGIGKSRLLDEVRSRGLARDARVLDAVCEELEQSVPFAAVRRLFDLNMEMPRPARESLGASSRGGDHADLSHDVAPTSQFRTMAAFASRVDRLATDGTVLLILDDLQWADPASLRTLASLAVRIGHLPVLLLTAARTGHGSAHLHRLNDEFLRAGVVRLELGPLDDDEVETLAQELLGTQLPIGLLSRLQGAAGNPLFVTEFVRHLWHAGFDAQDQVAGANEPLPREFRLGVLRRLAQLDGNVQDVVRVASVLGSSFLARDLATVADRPLVELLPLLGHAVDAGVLEARGDALAFRHGLVREAVYEHIAPGVRRDLHREVGWRLADTEADVISVAQHLSLGSVGVDPAVASWVWDAARGAASRSPAVAAELFERARDLLPPSSPDRGPLLAELVLAYAWAGRLNEAEGLARSVLAERVIDEATSTALRAGLVRALVWQGRPIEALEGPALQVDETADGPGAAMLAAETALAGLHAFDFPHAAAMAGRAERLAEETADDRALCQALSVRVWLSTFFGDPQGAITLADRAIAIADASHDGDAHASHPYFYPAMPLVLLDRLDEAERGLQHGRRLAEERGLAWALPLYHSHLGVKHFVAGTWDEAVAELEASLAIAGEVGSVTAVVASAAAWLAVIQVHRDDLAGAELTIAELLARLPETGPSAGPLVNWAIAELHEARGHIDEALAQLQGAWDMFMTGANITDPWSLMSLVRLCIGTGDIERARGLLPMVERQSEMAGTPFMRGQALRCQGLVADDPDLLLAALDEYRRCPRPLDLAAGCEDACVVLARQGRSIEATPLLEEAVAAYEQLGASRDVGRVRAKGRQLGMFKSARSWQKATATTGWESLTRAELRVVRLVVQRLSNPEVAELLFISRHTVESHLKNVYRKLGVSSRRELAAQATAHLRGDVGGTA